MTKNCNSFLTCKEEKKLLLTKKGHVIQECKRCGHRFTQINQPENHLAEVYSDEYFFGGKDGYPDYLQEKELLLKSGSRYAKIIGRYSKPGKVLDIGCAAGFIMKGFEKEGWECYGVELNSTMATYGKDELNLKIHIGSIDEYESEEKFDLVNLIQVMGSLYDPDKAIESIKRVLKKEGLVLVETWDMNSLAARFFGKYWHEYCPPSVVTWYSDKTLNQLFSYYGFELVGKGRPVRKIKIMHGLSLMQESLPSFFLKKNIFIFLSRAIGKYNVFYPPVDLKWYLFKSKN